MPQPHLRSASESLRVSRATIGQRADSENKEGTQSPKSQIADVMGFGQLGRNVPCLRPRKQRVFPGPCVHHDPFEYLQHLGSDRNWKHPRVSPPMKEPHFVSPLSEFVKDLRSPVDLTHAGRSFLVKQWSALFQLTSLYTNALCAGRPQHESQDVPDFPKGSRCHFS